MSEIKNIIRILSFFINQSYLVVHRRAQRGLFRTHRPVSTWRHAHDPHLQERGSTVQPPRRGPTVPRPEPRRSDRVRRDSESPPDTWVDQENRPFADNFLKDGSAVASGTREDSSGRERRRPRCHRGDQDGEGVEQVLGIARDDPGEAIGPGEIPELDEPPRRVAPESHADSDKNPEEKFQSPGGSRRAPAATSRPDRIGRSRIARHPDRSISLTSACNPVLPSR